ncbi:hydrolase 1, exosortase A system-associated [uncultured Sphingomonas sp.]|uniref:hydrolase 1, exosortase A system-associated n=1 Tax=uncultured Sphingomonas sp. TaxID=158754 RepID=UPI0035CAB5DB
MRRLITFPCEGDTLVGTVDEAAGETGLLIVSGGNEVRVGAHRGMATLAAALAEKGVPVLRFDRRGIGDSGGENRGWSDSADDIAAAAAVFRTEAPGVRRVVGFGNCDAAAALALFGRPAGMDAIVLANPWTGDDERDDLPPAAAIRARYADRLRSGAQWRRLLTGGVAFGTLWRGLRKAVRSGPRPLADRIARSDPAAIILAERDATAQAFLAAVAKRARELPIVKVPTASHSFTRPDAAAALEAAVLAVVRATR